jgi:anti-anti-sigma factor
MIQHTLNNSDKTLLLTIPGDILSTNADQTKKEIYTVLESGNVKAAGWTTLKLDLTAAKMIDSVGLNLIVSLYKEAKKTNAKTTAVISNPNIQRTFLFTRLDTHIQVVMA